MPPRVAFKALAIVALLQSKADFSDKVKPSFCRPSAKSRAALPKSTATCPACAWLVVWLMSSTKVFKETCGFPTATLEASPWTITLAMLFASPSPARMLFRGCVARE